MLPGGYFMRDRKEKHPFFASVCRLAVPVALQSILQSSFSAVDQIMIGQLGDVSVAAVGIAGKFASIFSVVASAVGTVAGIMISQYLGQKNRCEVRRSFLLNLFLSLGMAVLFSGLCLFLPERIMGLYTKDPGVRRAAAGYLFIIGGSFLPLAGATLLSVLFRCMEKARLPLYASIAAALLNTALNYLLIFGKAGFSPMGERGAAAATLLSQCMNFLLMLFMFFRLRGAEAKEQTDKGSRRRGSFRWKQYMAMLLPVLICEFLWSLGENVYTAIYGHMRTEASAAMILTGPIQGLMIGALCGLSQAAGVIVGKRLGNKDYKGAYAASKRLLLYGLSGSLLLSVLIILTSRLYAGIYQVGDSVKLLTAQILIAYALVAPFKVLNMILGGGIIRSGGRTKYVMFIDIIGTWIFGVPLGLFAAFVLKLEVPYVYFILSLEECVRFGISVLVFRKKRWMQSLKPSG